MSKTANVKEKQVSKIDALYASCSVKERDPSIKNMAALLIAISNMSGKQRSYNMNKFQHLYAEKFATSTVVDRSGTKVWKLFSELTRKVISGETIPQREAETIETVLDVGQRVTAEGNMIDVPEELQEKYKRLIVKYISDEKNVLYAPMKQAAEEISLIL